MKVKKKICIFAEKLIIKFFIQSRKVNETKKSDGLRFVTMVKKSTKVILNEVFSPCELFLIFNIQITQNVLIEK